MYVCMYVSMYFFMSWLVCDDCSAAHINIFIEECIASRGIYLGVYLCVCVYRWFSRWRERHQIYFSFGAWERIPRLPDAVDAVDAADAVDAVDAVASTDASVDAVASTDAVIADVSSSGEFITKVKIAEGITDALTLPSWRKPDLQIPAKYSHRMQRLPGVLITHARSSSAAAETPQQSRGTMTTTGNSTTTTAAAITSATTAATTVVAVDSKVDMTKPRYYFPGFYSDGNERVDGSSEECEEWLCVYQRVC